MSQATDSVKQANIICVYATVQCTLSRKAFIQSECSTVFPQIRNILEYTITLFLSLIRYQACDVVKNTLIAPHKVKVPLTLCTCGCGAAACGFGAAACGCGAAACGCGYCVIYLLIHSKFNSCGCVRLRAAAATMKRP